MPLMPLIRPTPGFWMPVRGQTNNHYGVPLAAEPIRVIVVIVVHPR